MPKFSDLAGVKFDRLTVVSLAQKVNQKNIWNCVCVCGNHTKSEASSLIRGKAKSCGCLRRELTAIRCTSHGMADSPEYRTWVSMIQRCCNPKNSNYNKYGGRGISVCERWLSFSNFYADMGPRPLGLTLDRIESKGNYEPDNCRWATYQVQNSNTSRNRFIDAFGLRKTITEWCRILSVTYSYLIWWLKRGFSLEWIAQRVTMERELIRG